MTGSGFWVRVAAVLLLAAVPFAVHSQSAPAVSAPQCVPHELVVMSYNIRLDTAQDGANAWPMRRDFLTGQVAMMRPEIVGFQEVLLHQRADLMAALPHHAFVGGGRDDGQEAGEFAPLAIDRRAFAVTESGTFWLSPTPDGPSLGWDAAYKRIVSWARVTHLGSGRAVLILNTHWDHIGVTARQESGRLMMTWLARNRRAGEAVIVLGDFNAGPDSAEVAQLRAGGMLHDAAAVSATPASGPRGSFNGFALQAKDDTRIDHIFVSAPWAVRHFAVLAQHDGARVPSDHFAVAALLNWDEGQGEGNGAACE